MRPSEIDNTLRAELQNGKNYTLEALEEKLGIPRADIHKAFPRLCRQPGWSIRPSNHVPYAHQRNSPGPEARSEGGSRSDEVGSKNLHHTGRAKGTPYIHDYAEAEWERTRYVVRRP